MVLYSRLCSIKKKEEASGIVYGVISRDVVYGLLPFAKRNAERPKPKLIKMVSSYGVEVVVVENMVKTLEGKLE